MSRRLHKFAKSLARGIDVLKQLKPLGLPSPDAAFEDMDGIVSKRHELQPGRLNQPFPIIIEYDLGSLSGHPVQNLKFQSAERQIGGKERVRESELPLLPQI